MCSLFQVDCASSSDVLGVLPRQLCLIEDFLQHWFFHVHRLDTLIKAGLLADEGTAEIHQRVLKDSCHFKQSPMSIYSSENQTKGKETNDQVGILR